MEYLVNHNLLANKQKEFMKKSVICKDQCIIDLVATGKAKTKSRNLWICYKRLITLPLIYSMLGWT